MRGEAVVIDAPGGKTIYALMTRPGGDGDYGADIAFRVFRTEFPEGDPNRSPGEILAERIAYLRQSKAPREVPRNEYPVLVTFRNEADPTTMQLVDPDNPSLRVPTVTRIRSIKIQISDEAVSEEILSRLKWLEPRLNEGRLIKANIDAPLEQRQLSNIIPAYFARR